MFFTCFRVIRMGNIIKKRKVRHEKDVFFLFFKWRRNFLYNYGGQYFKLKNYRFARKLIKKK